MNPLLEQFLSESRDALQGIGVKLMQLEQEPSEAELMNELFRFVHTLKGNSGLFEFPEMTRVLHAGEDLMDAVREGRVVYSRVFADMLLDAMDFVGLLCDEIETRGGLSASHATGSARLAEALRALITSHGPAHTGGAAEGGALADSTPSPALQVASLHLADIPEAARMEALRLARDGATLHLLSYTPIEECFFQGDDPFHQARQTPDLVWGDIVSREPWPPLAEMDAYRCMLNFRLLTTAPLGELVEHYRYVPEQIRITDIDPMQLVAPPQQGAATRLSISGEDAEGLDAILAAQRQILMLDDRPAWLSGRLKAVACTLINCLRATGEPLAQAGIEAALGQALATGDGAPLLAWLAARSGCQPETAPTCQTPAKAGETPKVASADSPPRATHGALPRGAAMPDEAQKFGRRAEDQLSVKSLKVDQAKIDRLMNLIGEMVVSKNALPYLAQRAENHFGVRELAREIKAQYAVINRIAEEMQDAIMQVQMMPVSFVFQRFPRLVRDLSNKLGKEVRLVLEGEETEADKNIIESLADPLIHIVRNSLDHGLETPELRRASGKLAMGTLTIRAAQEGDRVVIEIVDDGKGIDPAVIKQKAYEKGVIDEATLARISDRDAVNLVFAAGFSTAETVSDLSGRGVGMDVVRTGVEKVGGAIQLESEAGKGTRIRISLPLSMAVTRVMIVESDRQIFGVPMDHVVETVRVPKSSVHTIKQSRTTVLRDRIVPLKSLNALLGLSAEPQANADNELAVLVARVGGEVVGLLVDDFCETVDIIQKPLNGVLSGLGAYSGSALMGDGSVLMVLNLKEVV
jgi:two-component system, chemotaxis family, sensor kinase CheA